MNRTRAAIALFGMLVVTIIAKRKRTDPIKANRARVLTTSRSALGLPERRRGPSRGMGARSRVMRRAEDRNAPHP